ncbi:hypothetical protein CISG_07850 [Coccidioides immitis RMSCC 3703]|uniref:Uncharacterized protein n=1 Tax=Coccidioides immitis RMSCC 3703 TaxID=454286 RepID=A0A0J8R2N3_COCIT|nr:hypothetical protein CISG_07850 [Coccidioides immitis RMSCC 3703]
MQFTDLLFSLGNPVEDAEEEAFLLFSQDIPSQNLGFINSQSHTVEVSVLNRDLTIHQSPTVLSSSRAGGTTGAGSTSQRFSKLAAESPAFWHLPSSFRRKYIATDQEYVRKLFQENLEENHHVTRRHTVQEDQSTDRNRQHRRGSQKPRHKSYPGSANRSPAESQSRSRTRHVTHSSTSSRSPTARGESGGKVEFVPLDWETDTLSSITGVVEDGFDLLLSCDCIYNDALISPFVQTCVDIARLRPSLAAHTSASADQGREDLAHGKPTICIIAQQLRSHEVLENWLRESLAEFAVWRVRDKVLEAAGLGSGSGEYNDGLRFVSNNGLHIDDLPIEVWEGLVEVSNDFINRRFIKYTSGEENSYIPQTASTFLQRT